jgi:hypothetical protein
MGILFLYLSVYTHVLERCGLSQSADKERGEELITDMVLCTICYKWWKNCICCWSSTNVCSIRCIKLNDIVRLDSGSIVYTFQSVALYQ